MTVPREKEAMSREDCERGLLLRGPEIYGGHEVEEAVPNHGPHHEAREDGDRLRRTRPGEQKEDGPLESGARGEQEEGDVVHVKTGGEAGPHARENPQEGERGDREEQGGRVQRAVQGRLAGGRIGYV